MGKRKNYSKMYNHDEQQPIVEEIETDFAAEDMPVEEIPEFVTGVVVDCTKLNVRAMPDVKAKVLCEVAVSSELRVCNTEDYDDWYRVCTATGVEGFCMKQFIAVK